MNSSAMFGQVWSRRLGRYGSRRAYLMVAVLRYLRRRRVTMLVERDWVNWVDEHLLPMMRRRAVFPWQWFFFNDVYGLVRLDSRGDGGRVLVGGAPCVLIRSQYRAVVRMHDLVGRLDSQQRRAARASAR